MSVNDLLAHVWNGVTVTSDSVYQAVTTLRRTLGDDIQHAGHIAEVPSSKKTVAVLPFLDLTEGMKQGEFTDGMTEELIDKLSRIPGLRVPPPTSSFYYKDRQVSVSEIAGKLGVAYVLDGSVRKSGARLRVAAPLVRADTGYVIWSESYDRPWHYTILIRDSIAGDLAQAVKASLEYPDFLRR